jgi:type I restriction enzyme S subunit
MKLGDLCMAIVDCEHRTAPTQSEGFPSIRTPNIGRGYFILDGVNRVSEETYRLWTRRAVPQPGDLIMAREAPVGNVAMIPEGLRPCLGQRTLLIRPDCRRVDRAFLMYMLIGPQVQATIHALTNGVTVPHLNMEDVRALDVPDLPSLERQLGISGVLSAYDGLVEVNHRRIQVLDELIRRLFREWFVDLRFPDAPSMPHGRPRQALPEGWRIVKLKDVADVNRRQVSARTAPGRIRYIDIASVGRGSIREVTPYAFADAPGRARRVVQHGDILWSCVRPNRRSHVLILDPEPDTVASTGFAVLTAHKVPFTYLYQVTTTDDFVAYLTNRATGAAYPAVTGAVFEDADVMLPPEALLRRFDEIARPQASLVAVLERQNRNLRQTRDLLLPRLLSGQIELPQAEEALAEAASPSV